MTELVCKLCSLWHPLFSDFDTMDLAIHEVVLTQSDTVNWHRTAEGKVLGCMGGGRAATKRRIFAAPMNYCDQDQDYD